MIQDKFIINPRDIQKYIPTAELDEARVNPFILLAQSHDLRPILGEALYYDFMLNFDNAADTKYKELLNGKIFSYQGFPQSYEGIIEMMSFFTLARYLPFNSFHITRTGNVRKKSEQSEPISQEALNEQVSSMKSNAAFHIPKVITFLQQNQSIYTLYSQGPIKNLNKNSAKWFDI